MVVPFFMSVEPTLAVPTVALKVGTPAMGLGRANILAVTPSAKFAL